MMVYDVYADLGVFRGWPLALVHQEMQLCRSRASEVEERTPMFENELDA